MTLAYIIRAEMAKYRPDAPITVQDLKATSRVLDATPSTTLAMALAEVAEHHPDYPADAHERHYWRLKA